MGSNYAGRKQSQSPARFVKGEEKFLKRKESWIKEQNDQKDKEIERMQQSSYMSSNSKQILNRKRNDSNTSGVSGHGSFLNRNYYNRRDSRASGNSSTSNRSGSRSKGL